VHPPFFAGAGCGEAMQKKSMSEVFTHEEPSGHMGALGTQRRAQTLAVVLVALVVHSPSTQSESLVQAAP
jgi:hypothetical protein